MSIYMCTVISAFSVVLVWEASCLKYLRFFYVQNETQMFYLNSFQVQNINCQNQIIFMVLPLDRDLGRSVSLLAGRHTLI